MNTCFFHNFQCIYTGSSLEGRQELQPAPFYLVSGQFQILSCVGPIDFREYLRQMGIDHHRTTPYHPQSDGKSERAIKTIKDIIQKLTNNRLDEWEERLSAALAAQRNAISTVTGYSPFFLLYGRRCRMPMTRMMAARGAHPFGNRLDDLTRAFQEARQRTLDSRHYNRYYQQQRANTTELAPGDSVVLKVGNRQGMTSRWDPHWMVVRVSGPAVTIYQAETGKRKVVNRDKLMPVPPDLAWDEVNPRPRRRPRRAPIQLDPGVQDIMYEGNPEHDDILDGQLQGQNQAPRGRDQQPEGANEALEMSLW